MPWSASEAARTNNVSPRRCRALLAALHEAGLIDRTRESELLSAGRTPAEWQLSARCRMIEAAPVLVIGAYPTGDANWGTDRTISVRMVPSGGNDSLARAVKASGLSGRAAARRLGVNDRALRRMLAGDMPIGADDPILARAAKL